MKQYLERTETESKTEAGSDNTLLIGIGSIRCSFSFGDPAVYRRLVGLYREYLAAGPADIRVHLEGTNRLDTAALESAISRTRFIHTGNRFFTTSQVVSGNYDLDSRRVNIVGEEPLVNPKVWFNHLNQLMALAYYSGCKVKYGDVPPAFLVHGCGIQRRGGVDLFAGPCETGKTTVGRFCTDGCGRVINDEMVLVSRSNGNGSGLGVHGVPIIGGCGVSPGAAGPLRCVFLLKQSRRTLATPLNGPAAYLRFLRQIVNPAYIGQTDRRGVYALMADFSREVVGSVPVYELEFTLDAEALWRTVEQVEETLG